MTAKKKYLDNLKPVNWTFPLEVVYFKVHMKLNTVQKVKSNWKLQLNIQSNTCYLRT